MTQADRIRQAALDVYIAPAHEGGATEVIIRAGDLHQLLGLKNAMPAVCSAVRSSKFQKLACVILAKVTGPANGANVFFHFRLSSCEPVARGTEAPARSSRYHKNEIHAASPRLDLSEAVVLVSCVKEKAFCPSPARSLYRSDWFRKSRAIVEAQEAHWYILSARHGLLHPDTEVAPYEHTLNAMSINHRRIWAQNICKDLLPKLVYGQRVVFFAGQRYREFLVTPLEVAGAKVEVPIAGLAIGKQLLWLTKHL
jgi:hypothetical protein